MKIEEDNYFGQTQTGGVLLACLCNKTPAVDEGDAAAVDSVTVHHCWLQ